MIRQDRVKPTGRGTVMVTGGGWYWAEIDEKGAVVDCPVTALPGTSWRGWIRDAKEAAREHFAEKA